MNEPFDASADPVAGATIASSLSAIIDRFGSAVFFKPEEIRLLLRQDCPESNREIDLVLATLAHGVPQRLLAAHGDSAVTASLSESVDRLTADPAFDRATANWAVRTWAVALALPVVDPERPRRAAAIPGALSSFASVVTPLAGPRSDERAAAVARPSATPVAMAAEPPPVVPASMPVVPVPIVVPPQPPVPALATGPIPDAQRTDPPDIVPPAVASPAFAPRPVARSFPLKSMIAGVAVIGIAVAAWFLLRQPAVGPAASAPVVASAPVPAPVVIARPDSSPVVVPKNASEPAPASVAVEPPRIASDTPSKAVIASTAPAPAVARPANKAPAERRAEAVAGARPATPAKPAVATCTRATCGSVVSVRPLDASGTAIELIVRMDDRGIHAVRQSGRWQVGSRVQRTGDDRYVAIRAETASR